LKLIGQFLLLGPYIIKSDTHRRLKFGRLLKAFFSITDMLLWCNSL